MRPHIMVRTGRNVHRPKVIEKQERANALRLRGRQQTPNVEAGGEFFGVGFECEYYSHTCVIFAFRCVLTNEYLRFGE